MACQILSKANFGTNQSKTQDPFGSVEVLSPSSSTLFADVTIWFLHRKLLKYNDAIAVCCVHSDMSDCIHKHRVIHHQHRTI